MDLHANWTYSLCLEKYKLGYKKFMLIFLVIPFKFIFEIKQMITYTTAHGQYAF